LNFPCAIAASGSNLFAAETGKFRIGKCPTSDATVNAALIAAVRAMGFAVSECTQVAGWRLAAAEVRNPEEAYRNHDQGDVRPENRCKPS
jgi:hypothetical protein